LYNVKYYGHKIKKKNVAEDNSKNVELISYISYIFSTDCEGSSNVNYGDKRFADKL